MSKKVAKFVEVTITVRVIVSEDATENQVLAAAKDRIQYKARFEYEESGVKVYDDVDCPYDPSDPDDNPDLNNFAFHHGLTDEQMKTVLSDMGFKGLSDIGLPECASNCGYIWSFVLKRWFNKNNQYNEQERACLDLVRNEPEHQV